MTKDEKVQILLDRGITTLIYRRGPTMAEINFGYGATHYADIQLEHCINEAGEIKSRLKSPLDGLWYSR